MTNIYISWSADHWERDLREAVSGETVEEVRRLSSLVESGDRVWRAWAEEHGGEVLETHGGGGRLRAPAEYLVEVGDLRRRYRETLGGPVSLGIGCRPFEADLALDLARGLGGDRLRLYGPSTQEELESLECGPEDQEEDPSRVSRGNVDDSGAENEVGRARAHEGAGRRLGKADEGQGGGPDPGSSPAWHLGQPGAQQAQVQAEPPVEAGGDPEPGAEAPPGPDPHEHLKSLVTGSPSGGPQVGPGPGGPGNEPGADPLAELRVRVTGALKVFQERRDELQAIGQQDPELYRALLAAVQGMIQMARQVFAPVQKSESGVDPHAERIAHLVSTTHGSAWRTPGGFVVVGPDPHNRKQWRATPISYDGVPSSHLVAPDHARALETARDLGADLGSEPHRVLNKSDDHQDLLDLLKSDLMPGGLGDNLPDEGFDPEQLETGIRTEMEEHGLDRARAKEIAKDHLTEDPEYYQMEKAGKAPGEKHSGGHAVGETGRHHLTLPVGTQLDASAAGTRKALQVKVLDGETGAERWRNVGTGMVMGPDGQPVSSGRGK